MEASEQTERNKEKSPLGTATRHEDKTSAPDGVGFQAASLFSLPPLLLPWTVRNHVSKMTWAKWKARVNERPKQKKGCSGPGGEISEIHSCSPWGPGVQSQFHWVRTEGSAGKATPPLGVYERISLRFFHLLRQSALLASLSHLQPQARSHHPSLSVE